MPRKILFALLAFLLGSAQAGERPSILFIGDSLSDDNGLGVRVYKQLCGQTDFNVYAYSGARAQDYISGTKEAKYGHTVCKQGLCNQKCDHSAKRERIPCIDSLLANPPDLVVIQLGTNDLETPTATRVKQFRDLLERIHQISPKSKILWITPPNDDKYKNPVAKNDEMDEDFLGDKDKSEPTKGILRDFSDTHPGAVVQPLVTRKIEGMRPCEHKINGKCDHSVGWPDRDPEHFRRTPQAWVDAVAEKIQEMLGDWGQI